MYKYILVYPCLLLYVHVYAWISVLHCNIYFNFQSMYKYILICQNIYMVYTLKILVYYSIYYLRLFHTMLLFMVV